MNGSALNKQVEKVCESTWERWKVTGAAAAVAAASRSVFLVKVFLALRSFGTSCWFGHDDLRGEHRAVNQSFLFDHQRGNEERANGRKHVSSSTQHFATQQHAIKTSKLDPNHIELQMC